MQRAWNSRRVNGLSESCGRVVFADKGGSQYKYSNYQTTLYMPHHGRAGQRSCKKLPVPPNHIPFLPFHPHPCPGGRIIWLDST